MSLSYGAGAGPDHAPTHPDSLHRETVLPPDRPGRKNRLSFLLRRLLYFSSQISFPATFWWPWEMTASMIS